MQSNTQLMFCAILLSYKLAIRLIIDLCVAFICPYYICPFRSDHQALEKSKYEQSLETVRRFIAVSEKELELYYRHVALYGIPQSQKADLVSGDDREASLLKMGGLDQGKDQLPPLATKHFSDLHTSDISESDEEDTSGSEYDVNDDETEGTFNISEEAISDPGGLANRE